MSHRYYKRRWDENRGDAFESWGHSIWYFEVADDGYPARQIEQYDNGPVLRYDADNVEDEYGGLGEHPLDSDEFAAFEITAEEFAAAWNAK
jgi:hypothetical protein